MDELVAGVGVVPVVLAGVLGAFVSLVAAGAGVVDGRGWLSFLAMLGAGAGWMTALVCSFTCSCPSCCTTELILPSWGLWFVLLVVLGLGNVAISWGCGVGVGAAGLLAIGAGWLAILAELVPVRLIFLPTGIALGLSDGFAAWRAAMLVPWRRAMLLRVSPDAMV